MRYGLLSLLILTAGIISSQNFDFAAKSGGHGSDQGYDIASDHNGNIYICGWFSETAHFGDQELQSGGNTDVFLAKYDSSGLFKWARQGFGPGNSVAAGITTDETGSIYITGWFDEGIHFGDIILECHGLFDMFTVKYSPDGEALWGKLAAGEQDIYGNRLGSDYNGNIYVLGSFRESVFFGNDFSFQSNGNRDIFIAAYNYNGDIQWAKQFGGPGEDRGYGIECDLEGNICFTGFFNGECVFEDHHLYSPSITSSYIAKLNSSGGLLWVEKLFGGANDFSFGYGLGTDNNGNIYAGGYFNNLLNVGFQDTLYSSGGIFDMDIFTVKFNSEGALEWANASGGVYLDQGRDICIDNAGNCFVTGLFSGNAHFGEFNIESYGMSDIFITKFNQDGEVSWARSAGGNQNDYGYGITVDHNQNLVITGIFTNHALFGDILLEGWGSTDIFTAKIKNNTSGIAYGYFPFDISIYPNPSDGLIHISVEPFTDSRDIINLIIGNMKGEVLRNYELFPDNNLRPLIVNTNDFAPGVYLITMLTGKGKYEYKFVVQ